MTRRTCPHCGAELPTWAASGGPCPRCLMALGIVDGAPAPDVPGDLPDRVGPYRILRKIGEGGMGVVYEAEQREPHRKVALKIVRGGLFVDDDRVRMFRREAETLARLKHPGIAAIYESGRTEDGQHFFAMELVRGETLGGYVAKRPRPIGPKELELRLRIFRQMCDAVHYAHQRGVIHRDLKPSNVVITESETSTASGGGPSSGAALPVAKILDFGLARITEGDLAVSTVATELGVIKGTLPYMSPEQAQADTGAIDVRADVYALGVILYEMLAGTRPYDLGRAGVVEAVRVICEEPPRPLREAWSGTRRIDPDVETIVGKALEKEPDRRYGSVAALSEDVERYLTSQPILARPPSAAYQLRKFASRNRALVGGFVATFAVLVAGVIVSTTFGLREAAQRREAEQARADLEVVAEFQAGMVSSLDAEAMGGRLVKDMREREAEAWRARGVPEMEIAVATSDLFAGVNATDAAHRVIDEEILERALETLEERFADQPTIDARLRHSIATTYRRIGLYDRAVPPLESAVETRKRVLGDDHADTLSSMSNLAILYDILGRKDEAEPLYAKTLEAQQRVLGDDHAHTLSTRNGLANLYSSLGRYDEAEPLYVAILETRRRVLGDDHPKTLGSTQNLALLYARQGRYDEAEPLYEETVAVQRRVLGDDHPTTQWSMNNLGLLYLNLGRYDEAEPLFLEVLEVRKRVLGDDHPDTLLSMNNVGIVYRSLERYDEALPFHLVAVETSRRVLGDDHPDTLGFMNGLGSLYVMQERHEEAEPLYLELLEARKRVLGTDHPDTLWSMTNLGNLYALQGRYEEAEPLHRGALDIARRVHGDRHPLTAASLYNLACMEGRRGAASRAMDWLRQAVDAGYPKADAIAGSPDLEILHGPEFDALVEEVREKRS